MSENVKAMPFDTTAVNTGRLNCACALLEQKVRKELLWLACRRHVLEIVLAAVTSHLLESCKSSGVVIFWRFQSQWAFIDKKKYQTALSNEQILRAVANNKQYMTIFAQN